MARDGAVKPDDRGIHPRHEIGELVELVTPPARPIRNGPVPDTARGASASETLGDAWVNVAGESHP
jgi:hypothetical protein